MEIMSIKGGEPPKRTRWIYYCRLNCPKIRVLLQKELPEQLICLPSPMVGICHWKIPTIDIITNKNPSCWNKLGDHYNQDLWHVPPRLFLDPKKLAVTWHRVVASSGVVLCSNICVNKYIEYIYLYWILKYIFNIKVAQFPLEATTQSSASWASSSQPQFSSSETWIFLNSRNMDRKIKKMYEHRSNCSLERKYLHLGALVKEEFCWTRQRQI